MARVVAGAGAVGASVASHRALAGADGIVLADATRGVCSAQVAARLGIERPGSAHGFMQAPAVGRIVAEELLPGGTALDLGPSRLERFAGGALFLETAVR